jgi:hypothetical protein
MPSWFGPPGQFHHPRHDVQLRLPEATHLANDLDEKRWPRAACRPDRPLEEPRLDSAQIDAAESEAFANGKGALLYTQ